MLAIVQSWRETGFNINRNYLTLNSLYYVDFTYIYLVGAWIDLSSL